MVKGKIPIGQDRLHWRVGRRVCRMDTNEQGTIAEADGRIKVQWDQGGTSYYDRRVPSNVQLLIDKPG
jgi:hypothetical protein